MKSITLGVFSTRKQAEDAINQLTNKAKVSADEISYIYRNADDQVKEMDVKKLHDTTPTEGAKEGANVGATIGGIAGIAVAAGFFPTLAPLFVAGPLAAALGLTGAVGTVAAGALTGAAIGALAGALSNIGVDKEKAAHYEDEVKAGKILLAVHSEDTGSVERILSDCGASEVSTFVPKV